MIKVSKTSKLDGIKSWSLQARETCPGSHNKDGSLVDACKGCYATAGNYRFKNVKAPRIHNREDWKREGWTDDMVEMLSKERYFRWFDSGDVYHVKLTLKIKEVIERTPHVKHWLPTRSYKFPKLRKVLEEIKALPNASVRYSSDSILGEYEDGLHGSTILPDHNVPDGVYKCGAYSRDGKCGGCRTCYDKDVKVIGYPAHGASMGKVIKLKLVK